MTVLDKTSVGSEALNENPYAGASGEATLMVNLQNSFPTHFTFAYLEVIFEIFG